MIPSFLQDFLVEELKTLFKDFKLKNALGELSSLNIYPQFLPVKKGKKDTEHFPYIVVILQDGEDPNETDSNTCNILLMAGIYDDDENYQGYKDLLNVLQKVYEHLMKHRLFEGKYQIEYPIKWRIHDEDTYPYFFGAIETNWIVGKIESIDTLI